MILQFKTQGDFATPKQLEGKVEYYAARSNGIYSKIMT
jgi:hypothetical protein